MAKILIENLKNISRLEFNIPPKGVHVLTGINGSGKTTLLTCLLRVADSYAFQRHFKTSSNNQFDNFQSAQVTYSDATSSVVYIYRNTRWSPNPRKGASLLHTLGFNQAIFITSSDERFYIQNEELNTWGIMSAPSFFKEAMNEIFETKKYSDLRRKKLDGKGKGYGRWNYSFLMPIGTVKSQNKYFTEKNFSLGEILILNALFQLENVASKSLVLIDEVELALHPRVQVKFLTFLEKIASTKNLTVILSTHSSSLIKAANNLIYLERDEIAKEVKVEYNCYPAIALQNIAVTEEVQPDFVFYVEDVFAKYVLEELLNYYFKTINNNRRPIIKTLPVGGWENTMRLTVASTTYLIPEMTSVYAILDADVAGDINAIQQNAYRTISQQDVLNLVNNNFKKFKFLPITPELGIVELLNKDSQKHIKPLQNLFNEVFDITQIIAKERKRGLTYNTNPRKLAKQILPFYIEEIQKATNRDNNYVRIKLAEYFATTYCPKHHPELQQLFNPIFQ